jgi:hypothetical protein
VLAKGSHLAITRIVRNGETVAPFTTAPFVFCLCVLKQPAEVATSLRSSWSSLRNGTAAKAPAPLRDAYAASAPGIRGVIQWQT